MDSSPTQPELDPDRRQILELWRQHRHSNRLHRLSLGEMRSIRHRLGALLAVERDRQLTLGPERNFHAWLRAHQISRPTAYRLIAAHRQTASQPQPPPQAAAAKLDRPALELRGCILRIRLDDRELEDFCRCMTVLESGPRPFRFLEVLLGTLIYRAPRTLQKALSDYWAQDATDYRQTQPAPIARLSPFGAYPP